MPSMLFKISFFMFLLINLSGCIATTTLISSIKSINTISSLHSASTVSTDRRSIGEIIDNQYNKIKVYGAINSVLSDHKGYDINFNIYNKKILLTGYVNDELIKTAIHNSLQAIRHIDSVENEIIVGNKSSAVNGIIDSSITFKIKARTIDSPTFSQRQLNIHTESGTVYVMGRLHSFEVNELLDLVIGISGVKDIKYFITNEAAPSELFTHNNYKKLYL
jgi:osmotically-inducible protein OsmY